MENVIELWGAELVYPVFEGDNRSLRKALLGGRAARTVRGIPAVRGIDLKVALGERIGLYGPNGSGKSTLLRLLAGIYPPTRGRVEVRGRPAALLGVGAGVNPDVSVYDNIRTLLHLGATKPTVERIRDIFAWTELNEAYLGLPLRMLSSGMQMKVLVGAVTALDADILLMDEWLSVIDAQFLPKTEERMEAFISRHKALVLASHNYALLERVCDRIVHLEAGKVEKIVRTNRGQSDEQPSSGAGPEPEPEPEPEPSSASAAA